MINRTVMAIATLATAGCAIPALAPDATPTTSLAGARPPAAIAAPGAGQVPYTLQTNGGLPGVAPPTARPRGRSYAEWNAAWWTWALSLPFADHPLTKDGDVDLSAYQTGNVWFLGGSFGTNTLVRRGAVPSGTALFFPILNTSWTEDIRVSRDGLAQLPGLEVPGVEPPFDLADWRALASLTDATDLTLEVRSTTGGLERNIVNVGFEALEDLYTESPVFESPLVAGSILDVFCEPGGGGLCWRTDTTMYQAFATGYYVYLDPLPVGTHEVRFTGKRASGFELDVTYVIEVVPGER